MKISELEIKDYLAREPLAEDNSFIILNYAGNDTDEPVTYRVTLNELSNMIINNHKILRYTGTNKNLISTAYGNNAYANTESLGQFIDPADRTVLDATLTNVSYDTTNKKLVSTTRSNQEADDIVSVATILTDMNLNQSDTADSTKYVSAVSETDGVITVSRESFSPTITWTNAEDGVDNNKPSINISVAGNSATAQTPNEASTTVYGITKLSSAIDSNSETVAATSKAVKDALESLNITQITNTTGKTVATIDETDGKISATFQDISILSNQISDKGTAGCVATLDENGHVPASQLPSYVDDVLEGTLATFPVEGETGKIYVDITTNTSYRWSGSQYTKVASDLSLGETSATAYRGDYGAQAYSWASSAYTHAVTNKGISTASGLYKITTNSEGHVTAATAVLEADIMALHTAHTAYESGLYKITVNNKGHVTAATEVQKSDITALGIPGSDTTYEMDGTYNASTNKVATVSTVTSAVSGLLPTLPTTDGTYTLQVTISTGNDPVYTWETNLA